MSNLDKRGSYTPRRVREQRAYRLAQVGGVTGVVGVAGVVVSLVGVIGIGLPILLLIISALCAFGFMRTVGKR